MPRRIILPVASLVFWALPLSASGQTDADHRLSEGRSPVVIAHRSAVMGGAPENSLAAIEYAVDRGIDILHVNPQLTKDGFYILMHDPTLNRTTDVEAVFPDGPPGGPSRASRGGLDYVRDYALADIRRLRLLENTAPVPALDAALGLAEGRLTLMLGLKTYEPESLLSVLTGHDTAGILLSELYYSGTDQSRLNDLSAAAGVGISVSFLNSRDALTDLERIEAQLGQALRMICLRRKLATPAFVARAKELGVAVCVSGWKTGEDFALIENGDPAPWLSAIESGAQAVLTDQPDAVLSLMGR